MSMETVVRARGHHTDAVIVTALIVALVVLPAIVAGTAGALWIPHNDSWAHGGFNRSSQHPLGITGGMGDGKQGLGEEDQ